MTNEEDDSLTGWERRSFWVRLTPRPSRRMRPGKGGRDDDVCRQCRFPWSIHPWRYDPDEEEMVRFCSYYPAEPVRVIEGCIAP